MSDAKFWDKGAEKYAKDQISDMPAYTETLNRMRAILQPHHRVLEIGCGTGSTALELADGVDRYIGTDVSPKMIEIAQRKQTADTPHHLTFAPHEAHDLPGGAHDVILALNLLHVLDNVEETLAQIYDALPSGGIFIAKTALMQDGPRILRWIIPVMQFIGKAPYVRSLSGGQVLGLLKDAGFTIDETITQAGLVPRIFTVVTKP